MDVKKLVFASVCTPNGICLYLSQIESALELNVVDYAWNCLQNKLLHQLPHKECFHNRLMCQLRMAHFETFIMSKTGCCIKLTTWTAFRAKLLYQLCVVHIETFFMNRTEQVYPNTRGVHGSGQPEARPDLLWYGLGPSDLELWPGLGVKGWPI